MSRAEGSGSSQFTDLSKPLIFRPLDNRFCDRMSRSIKKCGDNLESLLILWVTVTHLEKLMAYALRGHESVRRQHIATEPLAD